MDIIKNKNANRVRILTPTQQLSHRYKDEREAMNCRMDELLSDRSLSKEERDRKAGALREEMKALKEQYTRELAQLKSASK